MTQSKTKKLILSALFAALCCVATMVISLPTPTGGYINIGNTFVISSGILLGPLYGAFAAGIGSMLSDVFLGYISYAPATFIIKFLAAGAVGLTYRCLLKVIIQSPKNHSEAITVSSTRSINIRQLLLPILCGIVSSIIVIVGYFLYEWLLTSNAFAAAFSGITGNLIQGISSTIIATLLYPFLLKIYHSN